jgi:hypothetical protein
VGDVGYFGARFRCLGWIFFIPNDLRTSMPLFGIGLYIASWYIIDHQWAISGRSMDSLNEKLFFASSNSQKPYYFICSIIYYRVCLSIIRL